MGTLTNVPHPSHCVHTPPRVENPQKYVISEVTITIRSTKEQVVCWHYSVAGLHFPQSSAFKIQYCPWPNRYIRNPPSHLPTTDNTLTELHTILPTNGPSTYSYPRQPIILIFFTEQSIPTAWAFGLLFPTCSWLILIRNWTTDEPVIEGEIQKFGLCKVQANCVTVVRQETRSSAIQNPEDKYWLLSAAVGLSMHKGLVKRTSKARRDCSKETPFQCQRVPPKEMRSRNRMVTWWAIC